MFHKYGAKRCEYDGIKFPSKLEKNIYVELREMEKQGFIRFVLRQIPFDLDHGVHRVDFAVFTKDQVLFIEAKGRDLESGKHKRLCVEKRYSIPIFVVKSKKDLEELMVDFLE
jgi:hypothetical protein